MKKITVLFITIALVFLISAGCAEKKEGELKEVQDPAGAQEEQAPGLTRPKVALVIDDWGYSLRPVPLAWEIEQPLTFSVLPDLTYSKDIAEAAHRRGYAVILHLPMESYSNDAQEQRLIRTDMPADEINALLDDFLKSVPFAGGVSNHQGSKATEDTKLLMVVFSYLKDKGYYFLDSLVTPDSKAEEAAAAANIGFISRSVFLDNNKDYEYIKGQFEELVAIARVKGYAVGIAHCHPESLKALKKLTAETEDEVDFVYLPELLSK